ncbi:phage tail protein [Achromobacter xylosoxidans]
MAITSLPTPPSRSDPENFPERADAFMAALPRFATEANALQEHVNEAAATVDQDAAAAALSRDAAAESRSQAGQSAQAAETARQTAAQKAGEAGASAQRAQQWAEKLGAPVEVDGFSAKHWAEVAARGAGLPVYMPDSVPTQDVGPIFIVRQGNAEWDAATGRYRVHSDIPVAAVGWWPLRASIPAGRIPADGQTISRATFPDLAAMVTAGTVPVVLEADWLADPLKRGSYTAGDGSTTIRVPDLNGRSTGSLGRVFLSGDGIDSNGAWGVFQRDQFQKHHHYINLKTASGATDVYGTSPYGSGTGSQYSTWGEAIQFNAQVGPPRSGDKTHPQNVTGVWTIQAFGTVTNPGAADAAQLATDYAALNAALQTQLAFTIIYPNGGTEAAPASVAVNTRYVLANPFPGSFVICEAQLKFSDGWSSTGWFTQPSESYGTRASQLDRGNIIVRTGVRGITASPDGAGQATAGTLLSPVQSRVLVWKCKG